MGMKRTTGGGGQRHEELNEKSIEKRTNWSVWETRSSPVWL